MGVLLRGLFALAEMAGFVPVGTFYAILGTLVMNRLFLFLATLYTTTLWCVDLRVQPPSST